MQLGHRLTSLAVAPPSHNVHAMATTSCLLSMAIKVSLHLLLMGDIWQLIVPKPQAVGGFVLAHICCPHYET